MEKFIEITWIPLAVFSILGYLYYVNLIRKQNKRSR